MRLTISVVVILCGIYTTNAMIDTETVLGCLPRLYKFNASKTYELNGQRLSCWDVIRVFSCWGRCDSFEYGDYKIPYKISYHPVCTYTGESKRKVKLRYCHPSLPDQYRYYEVFDASGCGCQFCNSDSTSCEYLNG